MRELVQECDNVDRNDETNHFNHVAERPVHGGDARSLLHRVPSEHAGHPPHAREPNVLPIHGRDHVLFCSLASAVEPSNVFVTRLGELLAGGQGAQALLADHNHLRLARDLVEHLRHEVGVGAHVLTTQPPATHAESGHLLEEPLHGHVVVHLEKGHANGARNLAALDLLLGADVQQRPLAALNHLHSLTPAFRFLYNLQTCVESGRRRG
mmetsp:Transcript_37098/g.62442  ORF Transcript_37098/g.62442 Transcript_37098/m.62442 type:complete len:210 (+) Transcript_37098:189-818(+)